MFRAGLGLVLVGLVGTASCLISNDFDKIEEGAGGSGATTSTTTTGGGTTVGPGGAGGSGVGGSGGTGGTGSGVSDCSDIPSSDDFESGTLDAWNLSPDVGQSVDPTNGVLTVIIDAPIANNYAWYNGEHGWRAWQPACGDFAVTVEVEVTNVDDSGDPSVDYNSGGLLVRSTGISAPNEEFWAMVNIGRQEGVTQLGVETKATQHGQSEAPTGAKIFHPLAGVPPLRGTLGMCRVGDRLHLAARPEGGAWTHLSTFGPFESGTPDGEVSLTSDVELGLAVNGYSEQDARVVFDNVTFSIPESAADCPGGGSSD